MFSLIGLGLNPPASLSLAGWEVLQTADTVYLEVYTNLGYTTDDLAAFLKRPVLPATRETVEGDVVLANAHEKNIALCIIGDIFTATTHSVLYLECIKQHIPCQLFPAAGIMNTVAFTGLELYTFGETVSIPYPLPSFDPTRYIDKIRANRERGLHSLCLLDIKADEGRFMTVAEGVHELLRKRAIEEETLLLGVARLGTDNVIKAGTPAVVAAYDFGSQPHCIVIPGALNAVEEEFIALWKARP
jgi:diphthine synthase